MGHQAASLTSKALFRARHLQRLDANEIHRHVDQAYNELLSIGVQRELPWNMFTSVSYVHSHDLHLPAALIRRNQLNPKIPRSLCPDGLLQESRTAVFAKVGRATPHRLF